MLILKHIVGGTSNIFTTFQHKCDLINMSYGEPALLPDYGRFVDLVNEVSFLKLGTALRDMFEFLSGCLRFRNSNE